MKVISYLQTVPNLIKAKGTEKELILQYFAQGVTRKSDIGMVHNQMHIIKDADVAVIQGWVHDKFNSSHLKLRKSIIDFYLRHGKHVITADANLFLYANRSNSPHHYLRYSFDGVFPNTGIYCDETIDRKRLKKISKNLNIQIQNNKKGDNILLCCQRNGGWSMGAIDLFDWIDSTISKIRKHSDRHIVLRPHPGDKKTLEIFNMNNVRFKKLTNVSISKPATPIEHDLKNTWAVVNHNSSSIVGPIIYGYHSFITDPLKSQCAEVSHTDFRFLETPNEFDREKWLQRISMFHWNFEELKSGECWAHMRNFI